jgi:polysaccharide biosynthesis/export protein
MKTKMKTFKKICIPVFVLIVVLSSCVSQRRVKLIQEKTAKEYTSQFENARSTTYRLQTGDHLYIRVYSVDPKTSKFFQSDFPYLMNSTYQYLNTYVVDEFGFISFSFIEKLYVKGLTVQEAKEQIQKQLDSYFKEATVYVKLVYYQVAVLGEVNSPGNYTIEQDQINVFQAIGMAGGATQYGNFKKVKLVRQTQTGSEVYILDLTDNKILESPNYYLMPNDVIYIEPRGGKSWAYSQFPYQTIVSLLSVGAIVAAVFID